MASNKKLIPEDIADFIGYNSELEYLYRIKPINPKKYGCLEYYSSNRPIGVSAISKFGRRQISFKGHSYSRVVWFLLTGEQPDTIDHIDGNPANDKFSNLRNVTLTENSRNRKEHREGQPFGVTYDKSVGKWRARTPSVAESGQKWLGCFDSMEEAGLAVENYLLNRKLP